MPNNPDPRDKARKLRADLAAELTCHESAFPNLNRFLDCSDDQPCHLDGCPVCVRRLRRGLTRETHRHGLDQHMWTAGHVYPAEWRFDAGSLNEIDLIELSTNAMNALEGSEAGRCVTIAGIDITYLPADDRPGLWQFHLVLLAQTQFGPPVEADFCDAFPPTFGRNVLLRQVGTEQFHKALAACYPSSFKQRLFYRNEHAGGFGVRKPEFRDSPLGWTQQRELAEWLLTFPVGSRLVLRNLERVRRRDMKLRFKLAQGAV